MASTLTNHSILGAKSHASVRAQQRVGVPSLLQRCLRPGRCHLPAKVNCKQSDTINETEQSKTKQVLKTGLALVLAGSVTMAPVVSAVMPAVAADATVEDAVQERARKRAARLAQVQAEREARAERLANRWAANAPDPVAEKNAAAEKAAEEQAVQKAAADKAAKVAAEKETAARLAAQKAASEKSAAAQRAAQQAAEEQAAAKAAAERQAQAQAQAAAREQAARAEAQRQADAQRQAEAKAASERAEAQRRASEEAARERSEEQARAARVAAAKQAADELAAQKRQAQLAADSRQRAQQTTQVKNYASKSDTKKSSSSPGFVGFTLGRFVGVAALAAAALAAKEYKAEGSVDATALLEKTQAKFDAIEDKPKTLGYAAGAVFAVSTVDFIAHLPLLNLLFPSLFQAVGIASGGVLAYKYIKEGGDPEEDFMALYSKYTALLPGDK